MLTDRVRVRWPVPTFGVGALAILTGYVTAFLFQFAMFRADDWAIDLLVRLPVHPIVLLFLLLVVWLGTPALAAGIVFVRNGSRLLFGAVCCMAAVLAIGVFGPIFNFNDPAPWLGGVMWTALLLLIAGVFGALFSLAGAGCRRVFGARLVEQDGALCWGCSYPIGKSDSAVCPECGRPASMSRRRGLVTFAAIWFGRHRVVTLLIAMALWGGTFLLAWREGEPRRCFVQTFDPAAYPAWVRESPYRRLSAYVPGSDTIVEDGILIVILHQERPLQAPRIWLVRGYLRGNPIDARVVAWSLPTVIRRLDQDETREALRNGLSQELLNEIRDAIGN